MTSHHLPAGAKTCHWGYFDAALPPVISVKSGDRVVIDTVTGAPEHLPTKPGCHIPPEVLRSTPMCRRSSGRTS